MVVEDLSSFYYGAINFKEKEGYTIGYHYPDELISYFKVVSDFWYDRCLLQSSCILSFVTDAEKMSFEYKFFNVCSFDTIDVYVDDKPLFIKEVSTLEREGKLSFNLPFGEKKLDVYLPIDAQIGIKNLELNGEVKIRERGEKVLFFGDSITQGYGTNRTGKTYVNQLIRRFNLNALNLGIGGYIYDENNIFYSSTFTPEKIIVSMGTNHYKEADFADRVEGFYKKLNKVYPLVPVLCISPIWRGDEGTDYEKFAFSHKIIAEICSRFTNVFYVDGMTLVENDYSNYSDGLHPNPQGATQYADNLAKVISDIKFLK